MFRRSALLALAALPALAAAQGGAATAADPVAELAAAARAVDPTRVEDWARAEPRVLSLDAGDRARLLAAVAEGTVWWAPLLNLYPGMGLGSLASRDTRGAWLTLTDGVAFAVVFAGVTVAWGERPKEAAASVDRRKRVGWALVYGGAAGLAASRVAGILLPFTFRGRAHRELERAFEGAPPGPRLGAFLAPLPPGGAAGAAAGIAVTF